mgnify:FL=1
MVFTSSAFLFLFLPLFLAVYHLLPARWRTTWILVASYLFYGWWRLDFLLLFILSSVVTYLLGRRIARAREERPGAARRLLAGGVVLHLGTLAYFKYFNFGVDSLNALLTALGGSGFDAWQVILPIGISFYIFQCISYLVDTNRGDVPGDQRFVDVAAYIALFPQLIAGPIVRYKDLGWQLRNPVARAGDFSAGSLRFMVGFCKKVLVADTVAPLVDATFALPAPTMAESWLGALAYAIQLFFDFSGYSDMAIGIARMMGLRLLENFALPYQSKTITEFWRRWHISLSRWLRDYLYIPLGGNRRGRGRTYVNLATVMVLGGLWHGAAWTFVLWGAWHGGLLVAERLLTEAKVRLAVPAWLAVARTFLFVLLGWVTFRATSFADALAVYRGMAGLNGFGLSADFTWQVPLLSVVVLVVAYALVWLPPARDPLPAQERATRESGAIPMGALYRLPVGLLVPLFALGILRSVANSFSPFLYFQF